MLVIPAIDLMEGKCVRLYQGDFSRPTRYEKDPVEQAREFQAAGFSRIHVVDLDAARSGSGQNRTVVRRIARGVEVPVQAGGGIRESQDVSDLLASGVKYLILGTVALSEPEKLSGWIERWGTRHFIVSLDLKGGRLRTRGWLEDSDVNLEEALERIVQWGIPQVICTDVERDGTLAQPNYRTYRDLLKRRPGQFSVIAAGGISRLEHVRRLADAGVQGAVIGRALYEGELRWEELVDVG